MKRIMVAVVGMTAALVAVPGTAQAAVTDFHSVSLPFLWPDAGLNEVTPDGTGGVWAGGSQGAYCIPLFDHCEPYNGNPVVRRYTGSSWKEYPLRGWSGDGGIGTISTYGAETWISARRTWGDTPGYLGRFDGSAFQRVAGVHSEGDRVSTGPAGTWLYNGPGSVHRRNGSAWTPVPIPEEMRSVNDVQARTATDAWLVGDRYTDAGNHSLPALAHFDGTSWTSVTPPELPAGVNDWITKVVPVAADDVWVIMNGYLAHWSGGAWTVVPAPENAGILYDLAVDASGTPWVAGSPGGDPNLYRYSGGAWELATLPTGTRVNGITVLPGTSTVWGVGFNSGNAAAVTNS
ncbi:hypothetical protein [Actinomadura chokoriensis]|uniref:hypothetical protein n=1 Tax=Actinomadura chokoriensis TaxID=454156 RepID=UPI0031F9D2CF